MLISFPTYVSHEMKTVQRNPTGQLVRKDSVEAANWYRKAAEQNHAGAQYNLGSCYFNGRGVAKSYVEAYRWAVLASGQGIEEAKAIM